MGGVSFAALNAAVNTTVFGCPDGDDGLLLPQAAAKVANPIRTYLFMFFCPLKSMYVSVLVRNSEATCDVETQVDLVGASAPRMLTERRPERVREIQLQ